MCWRGVGELQGSVSDQQKEPAQEQERRHQLSFPPQGPPEVVNLRLSPVTTKDATGAGQCEKHGFGSRRPGLLPAWSLIHHVIQVKARPVHRPPFVHVENRWKF